MTVRYDETVAVVGLTVSDKVSGVRSRDCSRVVVEDSLVSLSSLFQSFRVGPISLHSRI